MSFSTKQLLHPFKSLIERNGASYEQVIRLIDFKLMLDNRGKQPGGKGNSNKAIRRQVLSYLLVGIFMLLILFSNNDPFLYIFAAQSILLVMGTMTMLAEYSVSLFDTRDNHLILPLPVNGQTVGWARVLHILIYLLILSLSMMLPLLIATIFKVGALTAFLFLLAVVMNTLFTLFLTVFIYLALMKFTSGEKLKDSMMYLQVGLAILMLLAYQLVPRYLMGDHGEPVSMNQNWLLVFLPPAWFASFALLSHQFNAFIVVNSALALFIPLLAIRSLSKKLFYGFNTHLLNLDRSSSPVKKDQKQQQKFSLWYRLVAVIMGVRKREQAIFRLTWKMSGRERLFKQSILPVLAYSIIIPIIPILNAGNLSDISKQYTTFLYFTVMSSSMLPTVMTIGKHPDSLWLFRSLPALNPNLLFRASLKAVFAKFFLPVFLMIGLPLLYLKGITGLTDIVTVFIFNYLIALLVQFFQTPYLMFTQEKTIVQGGKTALKLFLVVMLAIPLGFLHQFLSEKNLLFTLMLAGIYGLLVILISRLARKKQFDWSYIDSVNMG